MADYLVRPLPGSPPRSHWRDVRRDTEPDGSHWHDCSLCCHRWHHALAAYAAWLAAGLDCAGQSHLLCDACTDRCAPVTPPTRVVLAPRRRA